MEEVSAAEVLLAEASVEASPAAAAHPAVGRPSQELSVLNLMLKKIYIQRKLTIYTSVKFS